MERRCCGAWIACIVVTMGSLYAQQPPRSAPPLTWESLSARCEAEAAEGFSGVVLLVRDGQKVFHQAYGHADRARKLAMKPDTVFAIGSTPIDFTMAGILLLSEQGKLSLQNPLSTYFPDAPEDKRGITLEQLLTGRSGLPDFHDLPGDKDKDHSWIDRDEAVRRILQSKLRFTPGTKRQHSHSAFGLLAAVIELVSKQSYQDFTRLNLFQPAGMSDTGFFGEKIPEERIAIGYGRLLSGTINAPPYWGKTSWLVMGSGGQTSTALDLWKWTAALRGGKLLAPQTLKQYPVPSQALLNGGDMYGFEVYYAGDARHFMVMLSNSANRQTRPRLERFANDLYQLSRSTRQARYTLGVQFEAVDGQPPRVQELQPNGAAARAGLRQGDLLLKANGIALEQELMKTLEKLLQTGEDIEFELKRDGQLLKLKVKPALKGPS